MTPLELLTAYETRGYTFTVEAGRLLVAPLSRLTDDERAQLREHKAELIALIEQGPATSCDLHPTPSRCHAPKACDRLGICGRETCISPEEKGAFLEVLLIARSDDNPHRAIERLSRPGDISDHATRVEQITPPDPERPGLGDMSSEPATTLTDKINRLRGRETHRAA